VTVTEFLLKAAAAKVMCGQILTVIVGGEHTDEKVLKYIHRLIHAWE